VIQTSSGLKQKADSVAEALLQAKDKMKCLKCGNANHLNSMCFVKKRASFPARVREREEEERKEERRGGVSRGQQNKSRQAIQQKVVTGPGFGDVGSVAPISLSDAAEVGISPICAS
jgi:hypothetical protein